MHTPSLQVIKKLAQSDHQWYLVIERMRAWIAPPNVEPYRPYMLAVFELDRDIAMKPEVVEQVPTALDARAVLFKAMAKPPRIAGPGQRPHSIGLADAGLVAALKAEFNAINVQVIEQPVPAHLIDVCRQFSESISRLQEPPGLLSVKGATPEMIGSLFSAAADFYRAEPWINLTNIQMLGVQHPSERAHRIACVMGNGGVEYGLGVYFKWADVEKFFSSGGNPLEAMPDNGAHSLLFNPITIVPFDDLDAIEQYGWEIVNDLYPVPMIYETQVHLTRRPSLKDLNWYEAALRAIPIFVRDHLKPDGRGDYNPIEVPIEVATHAGPITIQVKYPAGTLSPEVRAAPGSEWHDFDDEETDRLPVFDRRGMEGSLWQTAAQQFGAEQVGTGNATLDQAQQIMYQAWDEQNPGKRITLAHQALSISPDCADAYVLLAEEEADTVKRAFEFYQQGVEAGRRGLGEEFFTENVGHFWGLLETRPYMRALEGTANLLWNMKRFDEAIEAYTEMLRLNPNDNQGARYSLLNLLVTADRFSDAKRLIKKYKGESSAVWVYTRALIDFRIGGVSAKSDLALQSAVSHNPFVPAYLTGQKRIPHQLPDYIGIGDEREAISYASDHLNHWRRTPGAIDWLKQYLPKTPPQTPIEPPPDVTPRRSRRKR